MPLVGQPGYTGTVADWVQEQFDFRPDNRYNYMLVLIGMWVILQTCIYLTLKDMASHDNKKPLLDDDDHMPESYKSVNMKSVQDAYRSVQSPRHSVYSTIHAGNGVESMLAGGLDRFYEKYRALSSKVNLHLATPEVRFENLNYVVQARQMTMAEKQGTVGSYVGRMFNPFKKAVYKEQVVLQPMSGIIKPGSMTLILANPGSGKSTFLKALAGKLEQNKKCV
ncbi:hypothetical protein DYB32_010607, partial [Aphanomyces invadans]